MNTLSWGPAASTRPLLWGPTGGTPLALPASTARKVSAVTELRE